ncbi:MAG: hypothetical protein CMA83_03850 [Euryarchaeota archaeon]|nr:hypothetical protein [Euryarchaeota archaeon]|tara:strand:- start:218 stop:1000 length:783 start_codon:yes stop_codon:yes gene_type:complete
MLTVITEPRLTGDRKVSPLIGKKGKGENEGTVRVKNSFGLPAIKSCYGSTEWCEEICYALALQKAWKTVDNFLAGNWQAVEPHLTDADALTDLLAPLVEEVIRQYVKREIPPEEWVFRWFWNGDLPTEQFATAIRRIAVRYPEVQFWMYTRSFSFVHRLKGPDNLAVYLSIDPDNVKAAVKTERKHPWVHLAFCADTWEDTEELAAAFPHRRKGPKCPELTGKVPLVVWGEDRLGRGACVECGMCIKGVNNVRFASKGHK